MSGKPTVISTFAGCGGSSLGYKLAGFKELLAIDFDTNSVETFKLNFPEVPVWQRDIREVTGKEILEATKLKVGELDILDGSPPCQGFSTAGKRQLLDSRNNLFLDFARLIEELQPKVFVMENVSGQIKGTMKGLFREIILKLKSLNYQVKVKLMNAKYYSVPQSRERLIYIGVRNDLNKQPSFPIPNTKTITVEEAFKNVEVGDYFPLKLDSEFGKQYLKLQPGQKLSDTWDKNSGFNTKRLEWGKPANTITKTGIFGKYPKIIHPEEMRSISISECKRLCSFPDNFKLTGKLDEQWSRLGNAVMPNMMKAIALNIKENILDQWQEVMPMINNK